MENIVSVADILSKIGYSFSDYGKEYRMSPLYRPSDNITSLSVNKNSGNWYDYSARIGGSLSKLIQITLQLPDLDAARKMLADNSFIPNSNINAYELPSIKKFDPTLLTKLKKDHSYWINRGVSAKTLDLFQGGTTYSGRMAYRYVFPIFGDHNDIIGFSGRRLTNNESFPKWKHCGSKVNWCYPININLKYILATKEIILVESIGDMLSLWESDIRNVIVCFGLSINYTILHLCLKYDIQKIYIAFNNDFSNEFVGNIASQETKEELLSFFDEDQLQIALPTKNDFGDMNHEEKLVWKHSNQIQ